MIPSTATELGQNIAFSSLDPLVFDDDNCCGIAQLVDSWIDEGLNYDYGTIYGPNDPDTTEFGNGAYDGCLVHEGLTSFHVHEKKRVCLRLYSLFFTIIVYMFKYGLF